MIYDMTMIETLNLLQYTLFMGFDDYGFNIYAWGYL